MNDNQAPIQVDVSGIYNDPVIDAGIPSDIIEGARDTAALIGGEILLHFQAALIEFGVRKIVIQSVPINDQHVADLRRCGDTDAYFDYIIRFEGDYPAGSDTEKSSVALNNLIMGDARQPFIKDGKGDFKSGTPNRLYDMIGTCSAPYMPEQKYPVIYMKLGIN